MTNIKEIVCVDLDGTICDTVHRRHLRPPPGGDLSAWRPYHMACGDDAPVHGVVAILKALALRYTIHLVSGRHSAARARTEAWLAQYGIPYHALRLYSLDKDAPQRNESYKLAYINSLRSQGFSPMLFIEDTPHVADYLEVHGRIPVLRVSRDFEGAD